MMMNRIISFCKKYFHLLVVIFIISWSGIHNIRKTLSIKSDIIQLLIQEHGIYRIKNTVDALTSTKTNTTKEQKINYPPLCARNQIIDGSWQPVNLDQPPYISRAVHLRCYPIETYHQGNWNTFEWTPRDSIEPLDTSSAEIASSSSESSYSSFCEFTKWNRGKFCSMMEKATILISGDSLSWEQYSSLAQLLGVRVQQNDQHQSKLHQRNIVKYPCKSQTRLVYRRDDTLQNLTDSIDQTFPQVIVLNRGAHYVNDTRLISDIRHNIQELKIWQRKCKLHKVKCHLFWRTSVPGHPHCNVTNFTGPNNNLVEMESYIANKSNYDERTIKYHWYDYQRQNQLVVDELQKQFKNTGADIAETDDIIDILDAYYLNIRRPDEHRSHQSDCLHNCYPGKMDVYNQLLLHFLRKRRTTEDTQTLVKFFNLYAQKQQKNINSGGRQEEGDNNGNHKQQRRNDTKASIMSNIATKTTQVPTNQTTSWGEERA